jgi:hypothetical protein
VFTGTSGRIVRYSDIGRKRRSRKLDADVGASQTGETEGVRFLIPFSAQRWLSPSWALELPGAWQIRETERGRCDIQGYCSWRLGPLFIDHSRLPVIREEKRATLESVPNLPSVNRPPC